VDRLDGAGGDRLPGEHALAAQHDVSRDTVRDALAVLRQDGLVETRRGGAYALGLPVRLRPEVEVYSRMPTAEERQQLDLGEDVLQTLALSSPGRRPLCATTNAVVLPSGGQRTGFGGDESFDDAQA
jgi:DNA-binding transcriptional MocR family regulator